MTEFSIVLRSWKKIFEPDCRTLLDIHIPDTTARHWQALLDFLAANYKIKYSENGTACPIPPFERIWERRHTVSVALAVAMIGYTVNCFFFAPEEIEMDLLPDEITSEEKAKSVCEFLNSLARLLGKDVYLTGEGVHGKVPELLKAAVLSVNPAGQFSLRPDFANSQEPTAESSL